MSKTELKNSFSEEPADGSGHKKSGWFTLKMGTIIG